jgi:hypothetical protein
MARRRRSLRYGERWVDCAAARTAHEVARASRINREALQRIGPGQLSRILGRGGGRDQKEKAYARILESNVIEFAKACGVDVASILVSGAGLELPEQLSTGDRSDPPFHNTMASSEPVNLVPLSGVNYVYLGGNNYVPNNRFSFRLSFNIITSDLPVILSGFCVDYIAPDGCYCHNLDHTIQIGEKAITSSGNYLNLSEPLRINAHSVVQVNYQRFVRPPLPIQYPADCDYGDARIYYRMYYNGAEHVTYVYVKFEPGGDLIPISEPREPPVLSESILNIMLSEGLISDQEYAQAHVINAVDRYHIVTFDRYCRQIYYIPDQVRINVTDGFRNFFEELNQRWVRRSVDRA